MLNVSKKMRKFAEENGGKLPAYAFPGGYTLTYFDEDTNVLCCKCANENDDNYVPIVDCFIHWEGEPMYCEGCNRVIESEYGRVEDEDYCDPTKETIIKRF